MIVFIVQTKQFARKVKEMTCLGSPAPRTPKSTISPQPQSMISLLLYLDHRGGRSCLSWKDPEDTHPLAPLLWQTRDLKCSLIRKRHVFIQVPSNAHNWLKCFLWPAYSSAPHSLCDCLSRCHSVLAAYAKF